MTVFPQTTENAAENSNGICVSGGETYTCGCNDGFEWGTTSCAKVENCNGLHSTFPCKDTDSGLTWSTIGDLASWSQAVSYCDKLDEGGFTDWHLPTISELRTTVADCPATLTDGTCGFTDTCLASSCIDDTCKGCEISDNLGSSSYYGKLNLGTFLWSSSEVSDNTDEAGHINFTSGEVTASPKENYLNVRCVR